VRDKNKVMELGSFVGTELLPALLY